MAINQRKGKISYEERCLWLKWPSLSDRKTYLSLVGCYKIVFGYYHLNFEDFFNSLLLNLQPQVILINFMSNQQDNSADPTGVHFPVTISRGLGDAQKCM